MAVTALRRAAAGYTDTTFAKTISGSVALLSGVGSNTNAADSGLVQASIGGGAEITTGGNVGVSATALWLRDFWSYDARTDEHAVRERTLRGVPCADPYS